MSKNAKKFGMLQSRILAGQTQREAAEMLGVAYRTLQDWEHGVTAMPLPLLRLYRHLAGLERIPFRANPIKRAA